MNASTRGALLVSTLLAAPSAACGGKIASAGNGSAQSGLTADGGLRPVVDAVQPDLGPNSGGTLVRVSGSGFAVGGTTFFFAGSTATKVTCASDTECTMTSPPAGFVARTQPVDVVASVGGVTSLPSAGDVFTYAAGPDCSATQVCAGIGDAQLVVTCPASVYFYRVDEASRTQVASGTSYQTFMQCAWIAACFGSISDGSCTPYTLDLPSSSCGDPAFCSKCEKNGNYCNDDPDPQCCNGAVCTRNEPAPCP